MTSRPRRARTDAVPMTSEQRAALERWARGRTTPQRLLLRTRILLLAAEGHSNAAIAKRVGTTRSTVRLWVRRFEEGGPMALVQDAPGRGRKRRITQDEMREAIRQCGGEHWSVRKLASLLGVSPSSAQRLLAEDTRLGAPKRARRSSGLQMSTQFRYKRR